VYDPRFSHHDGPAFQNVTPNKHVMPNKYNHAKVSNKNLKLEEFTYIDNTGVPRTGKAWVPVSN
jgi:hypothetical protein